MKQALVWAWYPLLVLLTVASFMLARRVYVAYHLRWRSLLRLSGGNGVQQRMRLQSTKVGGVTIQKLRDGAPHNAQELVARVKRHCRNLGPRNTYRMLLEECCLAIADLALQKQDAEDALGAPDVQWRKVDEPKSV